MGYRSGAKLSHSQAEKVLEKLRDRRAQGLCTYRQAVQLRRYGLDPDMPFNEARQVITTIAAADWPKPQSPEFQALGL